MFENVVVGVTDSPRAARAVQRAMDLARSSGGTLHLVTAYGGRQRRVPLPEEFRYAVSARSPVEMLLGEFAVHAQLLDVRVVTHPVTASPADAIARVATDQRADLIVVGQSARHRGRRTSHLSSALVDRASCAILVV